MHIATLISIPAEAHFILIIIISLAHSLKKNIDQKKMQLFWKWDSGKWMSVKLYDWNVILTLFIHVHSGIIINHNF